MEVEEIFSVEISAWTSSQHDPIVEEEIRVSCQIRTERARKPRVRGGIRKGVSKIWW